MGVLQGASIPEAHHLGLSGVSETRVQYVIVKLCQQEPGSRNYSSSES